VRRRDSLGSWTSCPLEGVDHPPCGRGRDAHGAARCLGPLLADDHRTVGRPGRADARVHRARCQGDDTERPHLHLRRGAVPHRVGEAAASWAHRAGQRRRARSWPSCSSCARRRSPRCSTRSAGCSRSSMPLTTPPRWRPASSARSCGDWSPARRGDRAADRAGRQPAHAPGPRDPLNPRPLRRDAARRGTRGAGDDECLVVPPPLPRGTSMTPIQFQKQIRLHEARARLLAEPGDVASVGFAVGYDRPSQFSREYRRMFGVPPSRDAARTARGGRAAVTAAPASRGGPAPRFPRRSSRALSQIRPRPLRPHRLSRR
jgi:AraC-like DNA-binding protein